MTRLRRPEELCPKQSQKNIPRYKSQRDTKEVRIKLQTFPAPLSVQKNTSVLTLLLLCLFLKQQEEIETILLHDVGLKGLNLQNSIIPDGSFYFLLVHLSLKRIHTLFLP